MGMKASTAVELHRAGLYNVDIVATRLVKISPGYSKQTTRLRHWINYGLLQVDRTFGGGKTKWRLLHRSEIAVAGILTILTDMGLDRSSFVLNIEKIREAAKTGLKQVTIKWTQISGVEQHDVWVNIEGLDLE